MSKIEKETCLRKKEKEEAHTSIKELELKTIRFLAATSLLLTNIEHLPVFFKRKDPSLSILMIA